MKLRLYHYWRSSSSWRVRWAFHLKKIECDFVAVDLLTGESETEEHRKRNPLGFVPVLEFLDPDRTKVAGFSPPFLAESFAILEWAEETHPEPSLLPGAPIQRARIRQLAEVINSDTQPLQNLTAQLHHSSDPEEQKRWNRFWNERGLEAYEKLVSETAGKFSVGDTLTLADLFLIPQCYNAKRVDVSLSRYPHVSRIYEAALATESCRSSAPDRFQPSPTP